MILAVRAYKPDPVDAAAWNLLEDPAGYLDLDFLS
jgi:hypothetical protein